MTTIETNSLNTIMREVVQKRLALSDINEKINVLTKKQHEARSDLANAETILFNTINARSV